MPVEIPMEKWPGAVREITIGASTEQGGTRTSTVTVGGETSLPFMHFEAPMPNAPVIAMEIADQRPKDWSPLLLETWDAVMDDPACLIRCLQLTQLSRDHSEPLQELSPGLRSHIILYKFQRRLEMRSDFDQLLPGRL